MKLMQRNKRTFYYSLFDRSEPRLDEYGNETGEQVLFYQPAIAMQASISAAVGEAQIEQFGNLANYDKVILTEDMDCPIDENTVLFLDKEPVYDEKTGQPLYDYQVRRVAKSLNHIAFAVSKAVVS